MELFDFVLHIDDHLRDFIALHGALVYGLLFLIVFSETGFVVTPFLPGDSLLFAVGALAADGHLDPVLAGTTVFGAAVLGNMANYRIGRFIGPRVFHYEDSRWFRRAHLLRAASRGKRFTENPMTFQNQPPNPPPNPAFNTDVPQAGRRLTMR